jgi:SAM-dependent methyltransferase
MTQYADAEYEFGLYRDYARASSLKYETFKRRIQLISRIATGSRLLDVGCSSGFFIEIALQHGFDAYGIEISKNAIALAKEKIRARITNGDVNLLPERGEKGFDIIVAFDIIEHTQDPLKFLKNMREILSPKGWLVLATPDTGHFLRYLMGCRWPMLQPMQHTYLFSKRAMRKALELAGYDQIRIQRGEKRMSLEYLMGQIRIYTPLLAKAYKVISRLLPITMREKSFSINIGEMLVFCRNGF